jgi:hypothetical protein
MGPATPGIRTGARPHENSQPEVNRGAMARLAVRVDEAHETARGDPRADLRVLLQPRVERPLDRLEALELLSESGPMSKGGATGAAPSANQMRTTRPDRSSCATKQSGCCRSPVGA